MSCNRIATPRKEQLVKDADAKAVSGDLINAIDDYEAALDGSSQSAEIHYQMALLYDDKMNDPLNALHHFKRYLTLAPNGRHANEVKNFMKHDELATLTSLSGDTVVSRQEVTRLQNENLTLRKELEDARAGRGNAVNDKRSMRAEKPSARTAGASHAHTYVVKPGDTLASVSRKFYHNSGGWKKIKDANGSKISEPQNLKVGETLAIP